MRVRWRAAVTIFGLGVVLSGCDHGAVVLGENQTDVELLARVFGWYSDSDTPREQREMVSVMAPNSKLMIAELPFAGGFLAQGIDILRGDCSLIESVDLLAGKGSYIVVDDDARVSLRNEYPQKGDRAETTDRCRLTPVPTPTPVRTAQPRPSPSG